MIIKFIKRFFSKIKTPIKLRENYVALLITQHSWGHSIHLRDSIEELPSGRIKQHFYGNISPRPRVGDALVARLSSGGWKIGVVVESHWKSDPADWVDGEVEWFEGYREEKYPEHWEKPTFGLNDSAFRIFEDHPNKRGDVNGS